METPIPTSQVPLGIKQDPGLSWQTCRSLLHSSGSPAIRPLLWLALRYHGILKKNTLFELSRTTSVHLASCPEIFVRGQNTEQQGWTECMAEPGFEPRLLQNLPPESRGSLWTSPALSLGPPQVSLTPGETPSAPYSWQGVRDCLHGGWLTQKSLNLSPALRLCVFWLFQGVCGWKEHFTGAVTWQASLNRSHTTSQPHFLICKISTVKFPVGAKAVPMCVTPLGLK